MKKIISTLVFLVMFVGCSLNSEEELNDPIVGVWKLTSITAIGQEFINDCNSKDKIDVRTDKTFTIISHFEDNNCEVQSSSGTWVNDTANTYKFTAAGDTQTFTLISDSTLIFSFVQDSDTIVYSFKKE